MKKIVIIKECYVRDAQVLSVSLEFAAENLAFDDNFIDVKYPSLYLGEFEGVDEDEIRTKAAKYQGVHPDIITLIDIGQKNNCINCRWQPMVPKTNDFTDQEIIICPACDYELAKVDDCNSPPEFCPDCGQTLDWETDSDMEYITEFEKLRCHVGHKIETVIDRNDRNVSIKCSDCDKILYSVYNPRVLIDKSDTDIFEFDKIKSHFGHNIEIAIYGGDCNVSIECVDCYEVLYSVDNPEIEQDDEE